MTRIKCECGYSFVRYVNYEYDTCPICGNAYTKPRKHKTPIKGYINEQWSSEQWATKILKKKNTIQTKQAKAAKAQMNVSLTSTHD